MDELEQRLAKIEQQLDETTRQMNVSSDRVSDLENLLTQRNWAKQIDHAAGTLSQFLDLMEKARFTICISIVVASGTILVGSLSVESKSRVAEKLFEPANIATLVSLVTGATLIAQKKT